MQKSNHCSDNVSLGYFDESFKEDLKGKSLTDKEGKNVGKVLCKFSISISS